MDRWAATEIFQAFPEEPGSMPALSNLVSDPDPTVRSTAAGAIGRIRMGSEKGR
jgi:HEAT repeat protein